MTYFYFDPTVTWGTWIQLFGFIGAIWGISHQLRKQREMQKEKSKNELQIDIYEKVTLNMEKSSPTGVGVTMEIILGALDEARKREGEYVPPPFRCEKISNDFIEIHSNLWAVTSTIEKYEIVSPNLPLFRELLVIKIRELGDAYLPIIQILPHVLLSDAGGITEPEYLLILNDENLTLFDQKIRLFSEIAYDIAGYMYDIQVELQNILIGDFFGNKLALRNPTDDSVLVLTSTNEMMLGNV